MASEETRKKISEALTGRPLSEDHKKKLSEVLSGRKFTEEHRRKIGEANKRRGGHSEETKEKIRQKAIGRNKGMPLPEGMMTRIEHVFVDGIESKPCSTCKEIKPLSDFTKYSLAANGSNLEYSCKSCRSNYLKERMKDPVLKTKRYDDCKERRRQLKRRAIEYKGDKCADCPETLIPGENESMFDFHHRDPKEKDFTFGTYTKRAFEPLQIELDKCDLLCANCHRKRHQKETNEGSPRFYRTRPGKKAA